MESNNHDHLLNNGTGPVVVTPNQSTDSDHPSKILIGIIVVIVIVVIIGFITGGFKFEKQQTIPPFTFNESYYIQQWVCEEKTDSDPSYCFKWSLNYVIRPEYRVQINTYLEEKEKGEN